VVYMRMMGARVKRKADPRLITGSSTYVDDLRLQGLGHLAILRSIYGHATITGIDTSAAKALPGVIAVYTHENAEAELQWRPSDALMALGAEVRS